jgi:hypothetical protein
MPVTWACDSSDRFARLSVTDPYSFEEWRDAVLAILSAPVSETHHAVLIDRRGAEPLSTDVVNQMLEFLAKHQSLLTGGRVAVVVSDETSFGMTRMVQLRSTIDVPDGTIRPFRRYDEAVDWLSR